MFVMIIALLIFSLLGWPSLLYRVLSRIIFIPVIAGLSYELLRYAGSADNLFIRVMSVPGLLLQKLTTKPPGHAQLAVAIAALKAVDVSEATPEIEGFCDGDGVLIVPVEEPCEEDALDGQVEYETTLPPNSPIIADTVSALPVEEPDDASPSEAQAEDGLVEEPDDASVG